MLTRIRILIHHVVQFLLQLFVIIEIFGFEIFGNFLFALHFV
jgi:hypothetical protein